MVRKTESTLLRKLRQRCSLRYTTNDQSLRLSLLVTSPGATNDVDSAAGQKNLTDADAWPTNFEHGGRPTCSLPSSPLLRHETGLSLPPETRGLGDSGRVDGNGLTGGELFTSPEDFSTTNTSSSVRVGSRLLSTSAVDLSTSGIESIATAECPSGRDAAPGFGWSTLPNIRRSKMAADSFDASVVLMMSHAVELIVAADLQPEVVVEFLCRRDVVNEETVAAVGRCATKRSACELIAEVVIGKGRVETATLVEALRAAGGNHVADCLETVDGLLSLKRTLRGTSNRCTTSWSRCNAAKSTNSLKFTIDKHNDLPSRDYPGGKLDIDIVYVDPTSGLIIETDSPRSDVTSAVRHPRHRSVIIDLERMLLPTYFRTSSENNVGAPAHDDVITSDLSDTLPVVALTLTGFYLSDLLVEKISKLLIRFASSLRVLSLVKCHQTNRCLERLRQSERKSDCRPDFRLIRLNVKLSRDPVDGTSIAGGSDENGLCSNMTSSSCTVSAWSLLRSLSITGSGLTSIGCSILFRYFVAKSRLLAELDIGFNDVADVMPIADAIADNCALRRLRLRSNSIDSDGATLIFEALRRNYRLEDLDISGNLFGSSTAYNATRRTSAFCPVATSSMKTFPGEVASLMTSSNDENGDDADMQFPVGAVGRSLAEALVCNRTLRELRAERCGLGLDECRGLGRGLLTNATLTVLDLSVNPSIGDLGLAAIAVPMCRNGRCAVGTLSMNMCSIGNLGLRTLLSSIIVGCSDNITDFNGNCRKWNTTGNGNVPIGRTRLERIKLCYNNIGTAIVEYETRATNQRHQMDRQGVCSEGDLVSGFENGSEFQRISNDVHNTNSGQKNCNASEVALKMDPTKAVNSTTTLTANHSGVEPFSLSTGERHNQWSNDSDSVCLASPQCGRSGTLPRSSASNAIGPLKPEVRRPDDGDDRFVVYRLLCDVLAANPNLKILLWGNATTDYNANLHGNLQKPMTNGDLRKQPFVGVREEPDNDLESGDESVDKLYSTMG